MISIADERLPDHCWQPTLLHTINFRRHAERGERRFSTQKQPGDKDGLTMLFLYKSEMV